MTILHPSQQQASTLARWPASGSVIFTNPGAFLAFSKTPGTSLAKLKAPSRVLKKYPGSISFPHLGHRIPNSPFYRPAPYQSSTALKFPARTRCPPWSMASSISSSSGVRSCFPASSLPAVLTMISIISR